MGVLLVYRIEHLSLLGEKGDKPNIKIERNIKKKREINYSPGIPDDPAGDQALYFLINLVINKIFTKCR